ncbi:MAG TPA: universal stress protein [Vicinamibacterales bacterium]|nr:universal stress protein [Vicinamibacterales bacterium]
MDTKPARQVVVPVDFSDASARAVAIGGALADQWPARLHLMHAEAFEAPAYFTHEQIETLAAERRELHRQARDYLAAFGQQHTSTPFEASIETDTPTAAILGRSAGADLVVMGTHGRRGPSRWWLGSVAERVLREIDRPLLVVHAGDAPAGVFDRLMVVAEPPLAGTAAIALATALAEPAGGRIVDRRGQPLTPDEDADASLVVIAIPPVRAATARLRFGLSRVRQQAGPVLFVPEEESS